MSSFGFTEKFHGEPESSRLPTSSPFPDGYAALTGSSDESVLTYDCQLRPTVYVRSTLGVVPPVGLDKGLLSCSHQYSVTQSSPP